MSLDFKRSMLMLVVAFMAQASFAGEVLTLPANGRFIIAAVEAHALFKQCSRPAPQNVSGFWEPKPTDIDTLEKKLKPFLLSLNSAPLPARSYNRQYAGFTQNGIRYIYGNFYPSEPSAELSKQAVVPAIICDGGPSFWGIVYRVDTQEFQQPAFNGII